MIPDHFMQAIIDAPGCDLPRLVYADWLEESGEPANMARAEFIRLQCELARGKCSNPAFIHGEAATCSRYQTEMARENLSCEWCKRKPMLRKRERELWQPHARKWFGDQCDNLILACDAGKDMGLGGTIAIVSRGFASSVTGTLAAWFGGECERCAPGHSGWKYRESPWNTAMLTGCDGCGGYSPIDGGSGARGTGRTTGIGPALVRAHPVETVVLSGVEPYGDVDEEHSWWRDASNLPSAIFDLLGKSQATTRSAALSALSSAAIAWAKDAAPLAVAGGTRQSG